MALALQELEYASNVSCFDLSATFCPLLDGYAVMLWHDRRDISVSFHTPYVLG